MTLWSRLRRIFQQRANAALDRADDPIAAFELAYAAQIRAHEQAKRGIADVLTSEKRLEMEVRSLDANAARAFAAAGEAARLGDDAKARVHLEHEAFVLAQRDRLLNEVDDVRTQRKTLEATTEVLRRRLEAMRTERLALQARYATANATIRATEHVTGLSREMSDVARLIESAREASLGVQARAAALADIAGTATGALGSSSSAAIESRLAALKTTPLPSAREGKPNAN
jgi:phage shock protein A